MTINIGRFNIPLFLIALTISFIFVFVLMKVKKYDKKHINIISNVYFLIFISWKLSPIISNFKGFIDNPISALYLPGDFYGYITALIISGIYLFYIIKRDRSKKIIPLLVIFYTITALLTILFPLFNNTEVKKSDLVDLIMYDTNNYQVNLNLEDEIIVLNFWATWCPPCKSELPELNNFYSNNPDISFYGINMINTESSKVHLLDFIQENNLTFPVFLDSKKEFSEYFGIKTIPTTVVLIKDKNNYILKTHHGAISEIILYEMIHN